MHFYILYLNLCIYILVIFNYNVARNVIYRPIMNKEQGSVCYFYVLLMHFAFSDREFNLKL